MLAAMKQEGEAEKDTEECEDQIEKVSSSGGLFHFLLMDGLSHSRKRILFEVLLGQSYKSCT